MGTRTLRFLPLLILFLLSCNIDHPSTIVKYQSQGDSTSEKSELKVYKVGNRTKVIFETNGKEISRKFVSEGQVAAFSAFYEELQNLSPKDLFPLKTTETITITSESVNYTKTYNGHWNGFSRLKYVLMDFY